MEFDEKKLIKSLDNKKAYFIHVGNKLPSKEYIEAFMVKYNCHTQYITTNDYRDLEPRQYAVNCFRCKDK